MTGRQQRIQELRGRQQLVLEDMDVEPESLASPDVQLTQIVQGRRLRIGRQGRWIEVRFSCGSSASMCWPFCGTAEPFERTFGI